MANVDVGVGVDVDGVGVDVDGIGVDVDGVGGHVDGRTDVSFSASSPLVLGGALVSSLLK